MTTDTPDQPIARINRLLDGITTTGDERQILEILRGLSGPDLNAVLEAISINTLFGSLDDRLIGPDFLTEALVLLFRERVGDLDLPVRAKLVHGVQSGVTWRSQERLVRDLFLTMHGEELSRFKDLVNGTDPHYDLERLLFDDIGDKQMRQEILDHIAREAATLADHGVEVLSDIDDTLVCVLHDRRYPKGTLYPGILGWYGELDIGPDEDRTEASNVVFLTARPADVLGLIERYTRHSLHRHGMPSYSVLAGTMLALRSGAQMAKAKLANIDRYRRLFPEYRLVFIGDSGQGDPRVGRGMMETMPHATAGVFIHNVTGLDAATRAEWAGDGLFVHDTVAGGAAETFLRGLISRDGLTRIAEAVTTEMADVEFGSDDQRRARMAELETDLAAVERALGAEVMP